MIVKLEMMFASLIGKDTITYVEVEDQEIHISLMKEIFEYVYDVVKNNIECSKGMRLDLRGGYKPFYEVSIPTLAEKEYKELSDLFKTDVGKFNNIINIELVYEDT